MEEDEQKASLVLASYSLSLLTPTRLIKEIDRLWQITDKVLVLIERGDADGFEIIKKARNYILHTYAKEEVQPADRAAVIAPCGHDRPCPVTLKLKPVGAAAERARQREKENANKAKTPAAPFASTADRRPCSFLEKILVASLPNKVPLKTHDAPHKHEGIVNETFSYCIIHKGPIEVDAERQSKHIYIYIYIHLLSYKILCTYIHNYIVYFSLYCYCTFCLV